MTITAPESGPVAVRRGDLIIPGTQVAFGGFAAVLGFPSTSANPSDNSTRDIYLIGAADNGLQMARVGVNDYATFSQYTFFEPQNLSFSSIPPGPNITDYQQIYLPGTFSSGSVFYSKVPVWLKY